MIQSSHGSCYSGIVYDINGPKCAHSGLRKIKATFAEKGGKTAENNGMLTETNFQVFKPLAEDRIDLTIFSLLTALR